MNSRTTEDVELWGGLGRTSEAIVIVFVIIDDLVFFIWTHGVLLHRYDCIKHFLFCSSQVLPAIME